MPVTSEIDVTLTTERRLNGMYSKSAPTTPRASQALAVRPESADASVLRMPRQCDLEAVVTLERGADALNGTFMTGVLDSA